MYAATKQHGSFFPVEGPSRGRLGSSEALANYVGGMFVHAYILGGNAIDVDTRFGVSEDDADVLADAYFDAGDASGEGYTAEEWAEELFSSAE